MPPHAIPRPRPYPIRIALLAVVALALFATTGVYAKQPSKVVAKEADNPTVGRTVLTTTKGRTLYSFNGDVKPGEANGEGLKDVGTWHAAKVAKASPTPAPEPESPYPY